MEKIDQEALILRIAEIIILELKLEDITTETFNPDLDLVDEFGVDSMDLATVVLVLQDEYWHHHRRTIIPNSEVYVRFPTISRQNWPRSEMAA